MSHAVSQCYHIVYAVRSREARETTSIVSAALDTHNTVMTNTAAEENRPSGGEKEMLREFIPSSEVDENLATGDGRSDGGYHMIILERKVGGSLFLCRPFTSNTFHPWPLTL